MSTSERMQCWHMGRKQPDQKILNIKFELIENSDENWTIQKYKAGLLKGGNEGADNYEKCFCQ